MAKIVYVLEEEEEEEEEELEECRRHVHEVLLSRGIC
jgi:hypothetical protein